MIQEIINARLKENNETREVTSWHPSRLGSCLTGVYLERLGVPPDREFDAQTLLSFWLGRTYEKAIAELLAGDNKFEWQVPVKWTEYDISGKIDTLYLIEGNIPHEIKSTNSDAFKRIKSSGPKRQHQMQLWTYLKCLNLPEGNLVYGDRGWGGIAEYVVLLADKELENEVVEELEILKKAWETKVAPPITFDEKDWRAKYCRFHQKCLTQ